LIGFLANIFFALIYKFRYRFDDGVKLLLKLFRELLKLKRHFLLVAFSLFKNISPGVSQLIVNDFQDLVLRFKPNIPFL